MRSCVVRSGATLHISATPRCGVLRLVQLARAPWLSLPVCELPPKIGVSQGHNNAGKLSSSSSSPSVTPILNHRKTQTKKKQQHGNKKKKPTGHTSEHEAALTLTEMTCCSSQHSSLSFPGCIKLPQPPSKWLAPPGTRRARHPSSALTLRQRWRRDGASITAAISSLHPHKINK